MGLERKIVISAESGGAEQGVERIADSAESSFGRVISKSEQTGEAIDKLSRDASTQMRSLEEQSSSVFKTLLRDSERYSDNIKERSAYLDREITKLEVINREERKRAEHETRQSYIRATKDVDETTPEGKTKKKELHEAYKSEIADIGAKSMTDDVMLAQVRKQKEEFVRTVQAPKQTKEEEGGEVQPPKEVESRAVVSRQFTQGRQLMDTMKAMAAEGKTSFTSEDIRTFQARKKEESLIDKEKPTEDKLTLTPPAPRTEVPLVEEKPKPITAPLTSPVVPRAEEPLSDQFKKKEPIIDQPRRSQEPPVAEGKKKDPLETKIQEVDRDTGVLFKDIVRDAEKYSDKAKERLAYIDREITKLEKINLEERKRLEIQSRQRYEKQREDAGDNEGARKKARDDYEASRGENALSASLADLQARILRTKREDYRAATAVPGGGGGAPPANVRDKDSDDDGTDDERQRGRNIVSRAGGGIMGFLQSGFNGIAQGLGFGAVLSIGGFIGKMIDEGLELAKGQARAGAMGLRSGSVSGLKSAEAIAYSKQIALSAGRGDVSNLATEQGRIERGTGMELGSMNQFHTVMRSEGERGKTLTDATVEMLSIMKKSGLYGIDKGDFTMTHELLQRQNTLNELQAQNLSAISSKATSQVLGAFGAVGGSFGDQRQAETVAQMHRAITDPNNDFKNAFIMRSIKSRDPNASLMDVRMAQEEGIFRPGLFSGIMKDITDTFSGDLQTFNISKMFGLSLHKAQTLADAYKTDPKRFDQIGSTEDIDKVITSRTLAQRGGVSSMEIMTAKFNDQFSQWGVKALGILEGWVNAYEKGGVSGLAGKAFEDISGVIVKAFEKGVQLVKEAFLGEGGIGDKVTDWAVDKVAPGFAEGGKPLEGEAAKKESALAAQKLQEAMKLVPDNKLTEEQQAYRKRILEQVAAGEGGYAPAVGRGAEQIVTDIQMKNRWLFNPYLLEKRNEEMGADSMSATGFIDKHVLKDPKALSVAGALPEFESLRRAFIDRAQEDPQGMQAAMEEFAKTGHSQNGYLMQMVELQRKALENQQENLRIASEALDRQLKAGEEWIKAHPQQNYATQTVE